MTNSERPPYYRLMVAMFVLFVLFLYAPIVSIVVLSFQGPEGGVGPETPWPCDAFLLDVDHTPRNVLHPSHAPFYEADGLVRMAGLLRPGGVFALWSDDPPDDAFLATLDEVLPGPEAHVVAFPNPATGGESANTVYVARRPPG